VIPPRRKPRKGRVRDRKYLEFIRDLPCVVCWPRMWRTGDIWTLSRATHRSAMQTFGSRTEAAHVGLRGLGQKCSDRETIPLCANCHRTGPYSHHKLGGRFWAFHGLDRDALIAELNRRYEEENAA
jgi:hypothetical protein